MSASPSLTTVENRLEQYKSLLLPRLIEERMLNLLRQNKISKWFAGIGQEAISVGIGLSAEPEDYILPMHRNLGVFTTRKVPLYPLFCQLLGKEDGFTSGRDRSFHMGIPEKNIVGMISHLAATMPIADGLALAKKLKGESQAVFSFCGDGATSEGDFHEALNLAGVWKLPVIFVIENNGYGLSTPVEEQFGCENLVDRAVGYGLEGIQVDGNDLDAVMDAAARAREFALTGRPVLMEAITFRMRGHEEASGTFYIPDNLFAEWGKRDPIESFEKKLLEESSIPDKRNIENIRTELINSFSDDLNRALDAPEPEFNKEKETADASFIRSGIGSVNLKTENSVSRSERVERRFIDALQYALRQAFEEDDNFLLLGQDIAEYGGVFKVSEGFLERFGKDRIRNTPIIESGAIGAAIGLSLEGFKPVVEMQFADFISCGFNQIINNLSKGRYRWMPPMNVTIRAPHGAGVGAGPFHSQSPESWFMQHPGLRILIPSSVEDAQNMLYSALFDPNPVLFFEHKKLYRSLKEQVPEQCRATPLDQAKILKTGKDLTIVTYGLGVHWTAEAVKTFESEEAAEVEIVDLRSLAPIDWETVEKSVRKTGKVLLVQEPSNTMGPMSELSAGISEKCFEFLDAPIRRCSSLDTPIPFNKNLESGYLAEKRVLDNLKHLWGY